MPDNQQPVEQPSKVSLDLLEAQLQPKPVFTRVIIETPYAGKIEENVRYAALCCRDSFLRGENPFASHLFYPSFLDDRLSEERKAGIELGYELWDSCSKIIFYVDKGMSNGMKASFERAVSLHKKVEIRYLTEGPLADENKHKPAQSKPPVHGEVSDIQRP